MGQARYHWAIRRVVSKEESVRLSLERNKLKVVLLEGIHPSAVEAFTADGYTQIETHPKALEGQALIDAIADAHFVGLRSRTQLTAEVLEQAQIPEREQRQKRAAQLAQELVQRAQQEPLELQVRVQELEPAPELYISLERLPLRQGSTQHI